MYLERVEIIERIEPGEAAKRGLPPKEYVELGITPEAWDSIDGTVAASILSLKFGEVLSVFPRLVSPRGNIVAEVSRKNGPKATIKDHMVYLSNRVRQTLRR